MPLTPFLNFSITIKFENTNFIRFLPAQEWSCQQALRLFKMKLSPIKQVSDSEFTNKAQSW